MVHKDSWITVHKQSHIHIWCWERLRAGGEGGWQSLILTPWTWIWVNSGSWWWTGKPGVLQSMGSQRVGHNWATGQQVCWALILSHVCRPHNNFKIPLNIHETNRLCFGRSASYQLREDQNLGVSVHLLSCQRITMVNWATHSAGRLQGPEISLFFQENQRGCSYNR